MASSFYLPRSYDEAIAEARKSLPATVGTVLEHMGDSEDWFVDSPRADELLHQLGSLLRRLEEVGIDDEQCVTRIKEVMVLVVGFCHPIVSHFVLESVSKAFSITYEEVAEEYFAGRLKLRQDGGAKKTAQKNHISMVTRFNFLRSMNMLHGVFGVENAKFLERGLA